jgi:hypothetical protein
MLNKKTLLIILIVLAVTIPAVTFSNPPGPPSSANVTPNFDGITLPKGPTMQGPFGRYSGVTAATNGKITNGYAGARELCNAAVANSHVCTADEIIRSYEHSSAYSLPTPTGYVWVDNGPPAYISDVSNDCMGWTDDNSTAVSRGYSVYGSIWDSTAKSAFMTTCDQSIPVACCSY